MAYGKNSSNLYTWIVISCIVAAFVLYVYLNSIPSGPGKYDAFAQCLAQKGITMYGAAWCPHCQDEKAAFGKSFQYVTYVECPDNPDVCQAKGVESYPTWIFPDASRLVGFQELQALADKSGCALNK